MEKTGKNRFNGQDEEIRFGRRELMCLSDTQVEMLSRELSIKIRIKNPEIGESSIWKYIFGSF